MTKQKITQDEIGEGFYTYAFLRKDGSPYYVGKGRGNRAWDGKSKAFRRPPKDRSRILILKKNLTEKHAFKHEKYMIAVLGRKSLGNGILRNLTDGGEGASGAIRSEETRAKMSKAKRGRRLSAKTCAKISESKRGEKHPCYGKQLSTETRTKISEALRGERHPFYGKQLSAETRAKMSKARRGEKHPLFGTRRSLETRAKISAALSKENHYRAKTFIFTSPANENFVVTGRFKAFCREHGIFYQTMQAALKRACNPPPKNGWLVRYAEVS